MRLWHSKLIPLLDGRRLCDLHMSCCNLRGKGWGKPNKSVNYLYDDPLGEEALASYHHFVLREMQERGYKYDRRWMLLDYCGKQRPMRHTDVKKYLEACRREAPLLGHTKDIYIKDVLALCERGLDISLTVREIDGHTEYAAIREGIKTTYLI